MPAAAVRGIIISISILTALGLAVYENPQIQQWLEEQRKRMAELLRSIGEELDPASRRAAESFAYEGRTPANDDSLRREASGSRDAAAVATGSSIGSALETSGLNLRMPGRTRLTAQEAEDRRRRGREYLAARNQRMYEMRQRRKPTQGEKTSMPSTPTSFDEMVDQEGKLWREEDPNEAVSSSPSKALPISIEEGMKEIENALSTASIDADSKASLQGLIAGFDTANPFGDEYALSRSVTPKPPVPPKLKMEEVESVLRSSTPDPSSSFGHVPSTDSASVIENHNDLSYEEQMAIALSLSEAESQRSSKRNTCADDDADLKAAIQASLREMEENIASKSEPSTVADCSQDMLRSFEQGQNSLSETKIQSASRQIFESAFPPGESPWREPTGTTSSESDHDELYRVTPQLHHSIPVLEGQSGSPRQLQIQSLPYIPVRGDEQQMRLSAGIRSTGPDSLMSYSGHSLTSGEPRQDTATQSEVDVPLIDFNEGTDVRSQIFTPISRDTTVGLQGESDAQSDTSASFYETNSRIATSPGSRISDVEVIDVVGDSDVDMLSDEGDGIATPDSWTEVGSQTGESEDDGYPFQSS